MDTVLSVVVLAAIALVAGAIVLWRRNSRRQAGLMLLMAVVLIGNVLVWTVTDSSDTALVDRAAEAGQ